MRPTIWLVIAVASLLAALVIAQSPCDRSRWSFPRDGVLARTLCVRGDYARPLTIQDLIRLRHLKDDSI